MKNPAIFENIIYVANPAGKDKVKKPNITGIIQSIILFVCSCRGSELLNIETFCWANVVKATTIGKNIAKTVPACWTGLTKSIFKNLLFKGTLLITGFREYK